MNQIPKETIDQATQKLREKLSFENLIKRPKYKDLTREKHSEMLNFVESMCLILLNTYLRDYKSLNNSE